LKVERVGRWDHFFELGGHSLLAVQVVSRLRQSLAVEVPLAEVFRLPVLAEYARAVAAAGRAELPPIEPVERTAPLPLSFAQQRLWFLEQLGRVGNAYHIPWRLWLRGELDRGALRRALERIVARHEVLRTTFSLVQGEPVQRIAPLEEARFSLAEHDLSGEAEAEAALRRLMAGEWSTPFDLERGPLIRGRLIRLGSQDHVVHGHQQHVVSDGWSTGVWARELSALYAAFRRGQADPLPALPVQYGDYAVWQRRWMDGEALRQQAEYWKRTLSGAPELLELPTDRPRPAEMDHAGALLSVALDEELTAGLKALSQRQGTTLFMTLLTGWAVVLSRLSGQEDVVIGTPTANRGRREIEGLIGFFVNTLALRLDLSGEPTVAEALGRVRERVLEAQHHQDIPFEQVVEVVQPVRSLAHSPLFQVMFSWQSAPGDELELPGLEVAAMDRGAEQASAQFDLSLGLGESGGRLIGWVQYATVLFEHGTVERYLGYLRRVLEAMVAEPEQRIAGVEMLPEAERRQVVEEWNATETEYPRGLCVHGLFERQVERSPDAAAVVFGDRVLTYAELNARANRLAHYLRERAVGAEVRVAVCVERSPETIVGLLAVLKAGGAYVPLDPDSPDDRLRYMLTDCAPAMLLTQASLAGRLSGLNLPLLALDRDAPSWAEHPEPNPERAGLTPEHLAYVIYTSGSTGAPKGVMVQHRGVVNSVEAFREVYRIRPESRVLLFAPLHFDASVLDIFTALASGAALVLGPREELVPGEELIRLLRRQHVTHAKFTPSALAALPDAELPELEAVISGGEACSADIVRRWAPGRRFYNGYGPTETSVRVTSLETADPTRPPPIGRPVANVRLYVLDGMLEPMPIGVSGELFVGGVQVARGYLGRAGLTAERFMADPFGGEPGERLYRTGDRVRWLADGTLEFLGRTDAQVKVRGFRVEPKEIEAWLEEHAGVREAVVVAREEASGDRRLVAYWVGSDEVRVEALRTYLLERVPEYMVPAAYVRLERLPLTPNGKVDRRGLPAPEGEAFARRGYEAPVGEVEEVVAQVWAEVLKVERVGRWDHFFELGGHSLLAVQVVSRLRQSLAVEVPLAEVFRLPV
ncbi:MAG TPA: amino acid adenylation domain-containing protein, partial [Longimicrobiaceae bacterium]|nr:amino acid adenylation domain-containing protein [Longimicrobiaceae bacterium]